MTRAEYEAMARGQVLDSFREKQQQAAEVCFARMRPSDKASQQDRSFVAAENECVKTYFPEQTNYAAAQVRERFCACYAKGTRRREPLR